MKKSNLPKSSSPLRTTHYALRTSAGFTLVELIVAIGLFAAVMLVSVGTLLSLSGANRKAQAVQSVMNNLNVALDGMVRSIRMGSEYHCENGTLTGFSPRDCAGPTGGSVVAFKAIDGSRWIYEFKDGRLWKSEDGDRSHEIAITAQDVSINSFKFFVVGTSRGDTTQPKVVVSAKGEASAVGTNVKTEFIVQATAVQRLLDL